MKPLFLRWHLGLGDAIICNGLVRTLVERGHEVTLPCYRRNMPSVEAMFSDLPQVFVVDHSDALLKDEYFTPLNLGHYATKHGTDTFDDRRFDAEFFRQAGVPFLAKWEKFDIPGLRAWSYCPHKIPRFIHDDAERGFVIPLEGFRPDRKAETIFDYAPELVGADEIHCIDSSFANLADLLEVRGKRYLHAYARPDGGALPTFGREWRILHEPLDK